MVTESWQFTFVAIVFLAVVFLGREFRMPELFKKRQDTRRIRSYLQKREAFQEKVQELHAKSAMDSE